MGSTFVGFDLRWVRPKTSSAFPAEDAASFARTFRRRIVIVVVVLLPVTGRGFVPRFGMGVVPFGTMILSVIPVPVMRLVKLADGSLPVMPLAPGQSQHAKRSQKR